MTCQTNSPSNAPSSGRAGVISKCREALRRAIADSREKWKLRRELADLDRQGQLDAVLADLEIDRGSLSQMIARSARSPRLLAAMLERVGIDREALRHSRYVRDIERNCAVCSEHRRCQAWLDSGAHEGSSAFCPNAAQFAALKAELRQPG